MSIYIISDISFNNINNAGNEASLERYNTALIKGYDIDKPRNLAKSVTVE